MKTPGFFVCALLLTSGNSFAEGQAGAQGSATGQQNTSVSADRSGASASHSNAGAAAASTDQASANVAHGTELNATLSKPVDSRKSKPGDPVTATNDRDVKSDGQVLIPRGSTLLGHVTAAQPRGGSGSASGAASGSGNGSGSAGGGSAGGAAAGSANSMLGIVFDRAILKNGREVPINATMQAVASAQSAVSGSMYDAGSGLSGAGTATGSGGSAGGGALGGGALGGTVSGVTGATLGASSTLGSTVNGSTGLLSRSSGAVGGLNGAGRLTSGSQGVFGLDGLSLASAATGGAEGSIITSATRNVRLDSGTRMLLVTGTSAAGTAAPATGGNSTRAGNSGGGTPVPDENDKR